jgi:uncharacterized protein HemY
MRNSVFYFLLLMGSLFISSSIYAQAGEDTVESTMRSNDKIYVVLAICITILLGLFLYLISIDRKISRIEEKQ